MYIIILVLFISNSLLIEKQLEVLMLQCMQVKLTFCFMSDHINNQSTIFIFKFKSVASLSVEDGADHMISGYGRF